MTLLKKWACLLLFLVAPVLAGTVRADPGATNAFYVSTSGDDTTAVPNRPDLPFRTFQAALDEAGDGAQILVENGAYPVTPGFPSDSVGPSLAPIQILNRKDLSIVGLGAEVEIRGEGRGDFLFIESSTNIVVENIAFQGDKPEVRADPIPSFGMVMLRGANDGLQFRRCRFLDFGNHGITHLYDPKTSRGVTVTECYFFNGGDLDADGFGESGAAVSGFGRDWTVVSNRVEQCVRGFEIEGAGGPGVRQVTIADNVLSNVFNAGILLIASGGDSGAFTDIEIRNNQFLHVQRSSNEWANAILITGGERIHVRNNFIDDVTHGGIVLNASFADLRDGVIASNVVSRAGHHGIQAYQFPPHTLENFTIEGNRVSLAADSGILVNGLDGQIGGNVCRNNAWNGIGAGIEIDPSSERIGISDNQLGNDDGRGFQDYGVWIHAGTEEISLRRNVTFGNAVASVRNDGSSTDFGLVISKIELAQAGQGIVLHGEGVPERQHYVLSSTNFTNWDLIGSVLSLSNGTFTFSVPMASEPPRRFYRVSVE